MVQNWGGAGTDGSKLQPHLRQIVLRWCQTLVLMGMPLPFSWADEVHWPPKEGGEQNPILWQSCRHAKGLARVLPLVTPSGCTCLLVLALLYKCGSMLGRCPGARAQWFCRTSQAGARHQPGLGQELKQEPQGDPSSRMHHHHVSIQPNGEVRAAGVKGAIVLPPEGGRESS